MLLCLIKGDICVDCLLFVLLLSHMIMFIYFWLCWVFVMAWMISRCGEWGLLSSCGLWASLAVGPRLQGVKASVVLVHGLSGMWGPSFPGIETVVFCTGKRFSITGPPEDPPSFILKYQITPRVWLNMSGWVGDVHLGSCTSRVLSLHRCVSCYTVSIPSPLTQVRQRWASSMALGQTSCMIPLEHLL